MHLASRIVAAAAVALVACSAGSSEGVDTSSAEARTTRVVRLPGNLAHCPGKYQTTAPVTGRNTDYVIAEQSREFWMLLPPGDPATPHPLIVAFNGTGDNGGGMINWAHLRDFQERGFIVLTPSSIGNGTFWPVWDGMRQPGTESLPNNDLEYFDSLVDCVAAYQPIDASRVYVGGHSAGGIMANYVIQRRSKLLAGGIVGSGVYSFTRPLPEEPLDPMFVVVTWGGDNDEIAGFGLRFPFVTEAALASKHYDSASGVTEVNCRGNNQGHVWLWRNNPYFIDLLLAHPKGHAGLEAPLPAVPAAAAATCTDTAFAGPVAPAVACGKLQGQNAGCEAFCQTAADCLVENGTMQPVLHEQLSEIGFTGKADTQCGGCVERCATHQSDADRAVQGCFAKKHTTLRCEQGIEGSFPFIDAMNDCCKNHADSSFCVDVCGSLLTHPLTGMFFTSCAEIIPQ